jgi:hypothetical protein
MNETEIFSNILAQDKEYCQMIKECQDEKINLKKLQDFLPVLLEQISSENKIELALLLRDTVLSITLTKEIINKLNITIKKKVEDAKRRAHITFEIQEIQRLGNELSEQIRIERARYTFSGMVTSFINKFTTFTR